MENNSYSEPILDIMLTSETLKAQGVPLPTGQISPRSHLECDFDGSNPVKKAVEFAGSVPVLLAKLPPSPKPKSGRKITFASRVLHTEIRHIKDFSEEEIEAIWMAVPDYQMIKAIVKTTTMMMTKGEPIPEDDEDFCTRGLEFRTKAGCRIRSRNKLSARSAVLNEQDLQRDEGFSDPRYIAMACIDESRVCREAAQARAIYDERYVQGYLDDVR